MWRKVKKSNKNSSDDDDSDDSDDDQNAATSHAKKTQKKMENMPKETEEAAEEINNNKMLHLRLRKLTTLMEEQKQGCIRFAWNRDWNIRDFTNEEDASNLKGVPYKMYLSNKTKLLGQLIQNEKQSAIIDQMV